MERKTFAAEVKESNERDLTVVHFISTERPDRGDEILYADGMKINGKPVVLLMHGYSDLGAEPVAKPLWIRKGELRGYKGIIAKTQFYPDETGRRLWRKASEGYMPNWSVGWVPVREEYKDAENGRRIRHVYEWELLEYSLVGVPMQPDAHTLEFKIVGKEDGELAGVRRQDGSLEMKPYPNEHACRLEDPDKYIRFRRQNDKFGDGIHAIFGITEDQKAELQAIRFSADKFTAAEARAWLKEHDYKCKEFEPATGEDAMPCGCEEPQAKVTKPRTEEKGVIAYKKTPLAPEDEEWDAASEVAAADIDDLKIMCVWYDSENPELKQSYKGPHHKASGQHACVWNAVRNLAAVIMGARGGIRVPAEDMPGIKRHVASHYRDFDKGEPPWETEAGKRAEEFISKTLDLGKRAHRRAANHIVYGLFPQLADRKLTASSQQKELEPNSIDIEAIIRDAVSQTVQQEIRKFTGGIAKNE